MSLSCWREMIVAGHVDDVVVGAEHRVEGTRDRQHEGFGGDIGRDLEAFELEHFALRRLGVVDRGLIGLGAEAPGQTGKNKHSQGCA